MFCSQFDTNLTPILWKACLDLSKFFDVTFLQNGQRLLAVKLKSF